MRLLQKRAPVGGLSAYGKTFSGGEFLPFYVPRERMPQIDEADLVEFTEFAISEGISFRRTSFCPKELRAHQRIDFERAMKIEESVLRKPILVSTDHYILDGNHRWMQHAVRGLRVRAIELGLEFENGLDFMFRFEKTYSYGDGNFHDVKN